MPAAARSSACGDHRRKPRFPWACSVLAVTLLAVAACSPEPHQAASPPAVTQPTAYGAPDTAHRLQMLADTITTTRGDAKDPAVYRYSTTRVQSWSLTGGGLTRIDSTVWRAPDGSGRIDTRTLPPRRDPDRLPDNAERHQLAAAPATVHAYPRPDGTVIAGVVPEPVPDNPAMLSAVLYAYRPDNRTPPALLRDFAALAGTQYLNQRARAGALRMLAAVPGLAYDGIARDVTGRVGWAFTIAAGTTRDTILLDNRTGVLLTHSITSTAGTPALISHTLYLSADRTATPGPPTGVHR